MSAPNLQTRSGWLCSFLFTLCIPDAAAVWGPSLMLADTKYSATREMENLLKDVRASRSDIQTVSSSELVAALRGSEPWPAIIVIPEMEKANWLADRDQFDMVELTGNLLSYIGAGGRLLVVGSSMTIDRYDLQLMNHLFSISLRNGPYYTTGMSAVLNSTAAAGTAFESAPRTLEATNAVMALKATSLPPSAKAMFKDGSGLVWAFTWATGNGMLIFLAHDWHDPSKGWFDVLSAALWTFPDGAVTDTKTATLTTATTSTSTATTSTATTTTATATTATATTTTTTTSTTNSSTTTATSATLTVSTTTVTTTSTTRTTTTTTTSATVTTSTATTSTATTSTNTVTTITDMPLVCMPERMLCPVPQEYHGATYQILGSEDKPACKHKGRPDVPYYFEYGTVELTPGNVEWECNTSRTVEKDEVVRTVTLVPVEEEGSLILVKDKLMPILLCICRSPREGSAGGSTGTATPQRPIVRIDGRGEFKPELRFFRDKSFVSELGQKEPFPLMNEHMFVGVDSAAPDDVIGLEDCVAAPSGAIGDPYTVSLLQGSCPAGAFEFQWSAASDNNSKRFFVLNFRFGGKNVVYITCIVIRCAAPPCGVCAGGGRKLSDRGRRMQDWSDYGERARLTVERIAPSTASIGAVMILPSPVDQQTMVLVWEANTIDDEVEQALQADLNVYGFSEEFTAEAAGALERGIDKMLGGGTKSKVLNVLGLPLSRRLSQRRQRRMTDQNGTREVLTARVAFVGGDVGNITWALTHLVHNGARTGEFLQRLRDEFDAAGLQGMATALVSFEPFSKGTEAVPPPDTGGNGGNGGDDEGGEDTMELGVLILAAAAIFVVGGVCLFVAVRKRRRADGAALMNVDQGNAVVVPTATAGEFNNPAEQGVADGRVLVLDSMDEGAGVIALHSGQVCASSSLEVMTI